MKAQNILLTLFALAMLAVGVFWLLDNYEIKEIDQYTGYQGEARSNDLFAARRFLKRMGIPAERKDGLATLPGTDTVIVLDTGRFTFSEEKTQTLLEWVAQGGHLITRARVDLQNADEAEREKPKAEGTEDRDWLQQLLGIEIGAHQLLDEDELPLTLQLPNAPHALRVELDFFNALKPERPAREYKYKQHTWLFQQPLGEGLVTMASSLSFIENNAIDREDHAELLWYLLHAQQPDVKQVWLVNQDTLPNLAVLLLRHAWAVLLMVGLLLAFTFWALIPRFGALIPEPAPERRRLLEHIQASGQFLWKRQPNGQAQLLDSTRQAIRNNARTRIPGWQWLDTHQQTAALAAYLQLPDAHGKQLEQLLSAPHLDDAAFVRLVQLDHLLRKTT